MAHELSITTDGIVEAMYAQKPAWHHLGVVLPDAPPSHIAKSKAHLEWLVLQAPVFAVIPGTPQRRIAIPNHFANYRSDTFDVLAVVSDKYAILQNSEGFELLDALQDDGLVKYEAAFALRGGRRVVLLARMPNHDTIGNNDHLLRYVMLMMAHDGTCRVHILPTSVRTVCANTVRIAIISAGDNMISLRHRGNMVAKVAQAIRFIKDVQSDFTMFAKAADYMRKKRVQRASWEDYLNQLYPQPENKTLEGLASRMQEERIIATTKLNKLNSPSWWDAFNVITQRVDHRPYRGKDELARGEARIMFSQFGHGHQLKVQALCLAAANAALPKNVTVGY